MTESDTTPDPVRETAPDAPPAPDDPPRGDEYVDATSGAVFPVAGAGAGTVPVPPTPGRAAADTHSEQGRDEADGRASLSTRPFVGLVRPLPRRSRCSAACCTPPRPSGSGSSSCTAGSRSSAWS